MSQLDYYSQDPLQNLPHRQGLAGWGIAMIIMGSLAGLLAFCMLGATVATAAGVFPGVPRNTQNPSVMLSGSVVYVIAAVALIWLGIGSRQGRRWVRPLMIVASALTAIWGLAAILGIVSVLISLSRFPVPTAAVRGAPPGIEMFIYACSGFFLVLLLEVLPLCMLWFYARPSVQTTLDQLDPHPRWTERCPIPVLAWCFACALQGLGLRHVFFNGILPFYTTVLVGPGAIVTAIALAAILLAGAALCFKLSPLGWAMTLIACLIMAGSYLTFGILGDSHRVLELTLQNMPPASRQMVGRTKPNIWLGPLLLHGLAVGYAIWLWKWFQPGGNNVIEARDGQ